MYDSFDSHSRNFGELLGQYEKRQVVVPLFQRGYSWEKNHIATFWSDLLDFHQSSKTIGEKYFLGPIVILPDNNQIELLDGQQRLATATILFSVFRNIARDIGSPKGNDLARDIQRDLIEKDEGKFSLKLSEADSTYFLKSIQKDPPENEKTILRSHALIKSAQEFFTSVSQKEIEGLLPDNKIKKLKELKDTVASNVTMVAISVKTEDDAFRIFETLNDRGLRLSVPDLLLNYLMRTTKDPDERYRIREKWNFMLEKMGRRDIDRFLRHMWLSKYGDVKARGLFREIKDYLEQQQTNSADFADTCANECEQYVAILDLDENILQKAYPQVAGLVKYLEISSSFPLLLSGLCCLNSKDFERLAKAVIGLVVRHSLVANLNPTDLESAFYRAARQIRLCKHDNSTSAKCYQEAKSILAKINPSDNQVKALVENLFLSKSQARYIVTSLANSMQSSTQEVTIDNANLEHIFPLNPSNDWQNITDLEQFTWHIGNLTILGTRLNQQAANSEYKSKVEKYYTQSAIKMTSEIPQKYNQWTHTEVIQRAKSIAHLFIQIWRGP